MKPTQFFRPAGLLILALRVLSVALMGLLLWELLGTDGVKTIHMVQMLLFFGLLALVRGI